MYRKFNKSVHRTLYGYYLVCIYIYIFYHTLNFSDALLYKSIMLHTLQLPKTNILGPLELHNTNLIKY